MIENNLEFEGEESYLPNINQYKYKHLNKYNEDEFINAFVLELIIEPSE